MSDQIESVLREFEDALADFFAGGQRDATRLYDARMRLYSHPEFASTSDDYAKAVARAHAAGMVAWRLEPIREVWIHDEGFAAVSRLSMRRIMARRMNEITVVA